MNLKWGLGVLATVIVLTPYAARSQYIGLYADEAGLENELYPPPLGQETSIHVVLKNTGPGLAVVSFALPIPTCIPYTIVRVTPAPGMLMYGDLQTGIQVAFGECRTGDFAMLKIDVVRTGESTPGCCVLELVPGAFSELPEQLAGLDCTIPVGQLRPLSQCNIAVEGETSCVQLQPPSDPSPSDGALNVPTNVQLACALQNGVSYANCMPLSSESVRIYFGTDQDPPAAANGWWLPFTPQNVLPNTTYYWRVVHWYYGLGPVSSPVWRFTTTTTPNPVATSTWGRIKAFYRH